MARTYSAEYVTKLKLDYKEATKNLDEFQKEYTKLEKQVQDQNNATSKSIKNIEKSSSSAAKGIKGIGNAIKAAGIGLAIAAFAKLTEVFNQNQKVADFFNTTFEVLSLTFNDFFNFLQRNIGAVSGYFKAIFDDPIQSIKDFSSAIYDGIVARLKQGLEALGMFGSAAVKFFAGDFAGAFQTAKDASKELFDVVTGEDGGYEKIKESVKGAVQGIKEYVKSTIDTAASMVELNKQARLNEVINQGLIEKYDRQAEKLRQVRDDEANTIQERIEANEKLGRVLDEQEKKMLENAQARIKAAELELSKNQENIDAQIEYQEALNEQAAIEAQIEGFRSEQLMNRMSLQRELSDMTKEDAVEEAEVFEWTQEAKNEAIQQGVAGAVALVGENSKFAKGIAIANAIRDTYAGASKALAQGGIFGAIGAASIIASGLANVRAITQTDDPAAPSYASYSGGGASITPPTVEAQAPDFNVVGVGGTNQLADAIAGQQAKPQRAYVVSNDVTTAQGLERNIVEGASI
jgi:hypothetical protein